jgi:AcrR family transcriptional regulator
MKKGETTRQLILDRATALARTAGLAGVSIGQLADDLGLSKSGLFAHFGSKDALHLAVVQHARDEFVADVIAPALKVARGEPRLRAMFQRWTVGRAARRCVFVSLSAELDDRPGPVRDALAGALRDWLDTLATAARIAVDEGHLRADTDPGQVAFEAWGIMLATHDAGRLLGDPKVAVRSQRAFDALLARHR